MGSIPRQVGRKAGQVTKEEWTAGDKIMTREC